MIEPFTPTRYGEHTTLLAAVRVPQPDGVLESAVARMVPSRLKASVNADSYSPSEQTLLRERLARVDV